MEYKIDEKSGKLLKTYTNDGICIVEGCDRPRYEKKICVGHYKQIVRNGKIINKKISSPGQPGDLVGKRFGHLVAIEATDKRAPNGSIIWNCICDCGSWKEAHAGSLKNGSLKSCGCGKHKPRKIIPNPVRFEDDIAYISTLNRKGEQIAEFLIDADDYDKIKNHRWFLGAYDYIVMNDKNSSYKGKKTYLHRFLVAGSSAHIDHIDRNKLNNRRNNLRPATFTENFGNQEKHRTYAGKPTTSKYKGVCYHKTSKLWVARISFERETRTKSFDSEIDAARQYNEWAKILFGEFALINDIK